MWLQVINPFERDEATHDAQVARARLIAALRSEHGSDERLMVEASFLADGREAAIDRLVKVKVGEKLMEILTELRDDPEWKERLEFTERSEELLARPTSDPEQKMLNEINAAYIAEINSRQQIEQDYQSHRYNAMTDEQLVEEYVEIYTERRGNELAGAEYAMTEAWYACRACDATRTDDGWDHGTCEGHQVQVFETKAELRSAPEALQDLLYDSLKGLAMSVRDARFSARQGSSSQSSPLPSEGAASTPSTPAATPDDAPGPSTPPSPTP